MRIDKIFYVGNVNEMYLWKKELIGYHLLKQNPFIRMNAVKDINIFFISCYTAP